MATEPRRVAALLRTTTFRLTLLYSVLFGLSATVLALFFYWSTIGLLVRETDATLKAEITGLAEHYIEHGLDRLVQVIAHRLSTDDSGDMLYLFASRDFQPLAGNLRAWPTADADDAGWIEFEHHAADGRRLPARARAYVLRDGMHLLVGRNISHIVELRRVVKRALALGGGLLLALAVAGGVFMSGRLARRVAQMTAAISDIVAGRLERRLAVTPAGDEFDQLAAQVNHMLDRLENLIATVRHVSDNVAHDLRTPLTRLRNRIELASRTAPADLATDLETAVAEADALLATFTSLLRIARIESGSYDARTDALDLGALVSDAADFYRDLAQDKALELQVDASQAVTVQGDRNLLFQAVTNLLDNALKYTPRGGRVRVVLSQFDGRAVIEIRDNGPGIPAAERGRVTDRFARLDQSRSEPGSGLGLSLVKAIAELHRGELVFSDNRPGLVAALHLPAI